MDLTGIIKLLQDLLIQTADLHRRLENVVHIGPVTDVDPVQGNQVKSPWLPHPESGGTVSTWMPLSLGQIVASLAPAGDPEMAFLVRAGFSTANPPPSGDLGEVVLLNMGDVRISATSAGITLKVGASTVSITADSITHTAATVHNVGASLLHNDKNVGDTHTHGGVTPGGSPTAVPT